MDHRIKEIVEKEYLRNDLPEFGPGDTVVVGYKVIEGDKERVQEFEGVVISKRGGKGTGATFTVRKISHGVGVERIFPYHSPRIAYVKVKRYGKVRRAKLYYLRGRSMKEARIKEHVKKMLMLHQQLREEKKQRKKKQEDTSKA